MPDLIDNQTAGRFEMLFSEHRAHATYHLKQTTLYIDYVAAPPELRGTGAASQLMVAIVDYARSHQFKVVAICSYAAHWFTKHPESQDVLAS